MKFPFATYIMSAEDQHRLIDLQTCGPSANASAGVCGRIRLHVEQALQTFKYN